MKKLQEPDTTIEIYNMKQALRMVYHYFQSPASYSEEEKKFLIETVVANMEIFKEKK